MPAKASGTRAFVSSRQAQQHFSHIPPAIKTMQYVGIITDSTINDIFNQL
jgi:hypothetical protein